MENIPYVILLKSNLYINHYIFYNLGLNFINKLYIIFIHKLYIILLSCISINVHLTLEQRVCSNNYSLAIRCHFRNWTPPWYSDPSRVFDTFHSNHKKNRWIKFVSITIYRERQEVESSLYNCDPLPLSSFKYQRNQKKKVKRNVKTFIIYMFNSYYILETIPRSMIPDTCKENLRYIYICMYKCLHQVLCRFLF